MSEVGVVIPCFNQAHYLASAIESVLAQTHDDWRMIVVDDGSTDATPGVAHSFRDRRVSYIHQPNQGLSAARNAGLSMLSSEYCLFLDADDFIHPEFMARLSERLDAQPDIGLTYAAWCLTDADGNPLPGRTDETRQGQILADLAVTNLFPTCALLVRRSLIEAAGGFDVALSSLEDWDLWLRIIGQGWSVDRVEDELAFYRQHGDSMSRDPERMRANKLAVIEKMQGLPWATELASVFDRARAVAEVDVAVALLRAGEVSASAERLIQASRHAPHVLAERETWYRLAYAWERPGYRGFESSEVLEKSRDATRALISALAARAGSLENADALLDSAGHLRSEVLATEFARSGRSDIAWEILRQHALQKPGAVFRASFLRACSVLVPGRQTLSRLFKRVQGQNA